MLTVAQHCELFLLISNSPVKCVPYPGTYHGINSDGSVTPPIRLIGSSEGNAISAIEEAEGGYTVTKVDGDYKYMQENAHGELVDTGLQAGRDDPELANLQRHARPTRNMTYSQGQIRSLRGSGTKLRRLDPAIWQGSVKNLVIPFKFSDHIDRPVPTKQQLLQIMNGSTNSVQDVFKKSSYGKLTLVSVVTDWIVLPQTEAYYAGQNSGDRAREMIYHALEEVQRTIAANFTDFDENHDGNIDSIGFFHSGYGAEWGGTDSYGAEYQHRIWSHKWNLSYKKFTSRSGITVDLYHVSPALWGISGSEVGRIGVVAHETAHFLGIDDLYDTDNNDHSVFFSWGLLANAWGFDGSQRYPPIMCPWSKLQMGWVNPIEVTRDGTYTLRRSCDFPDIIKISTNFPSGEYLLIENRQACGYDAKVPKGGLAIWHIDDLAGYQTQGYPAQEYWPENGNHYRVALLQADGGYDLERGTNQGDATDLYASDGSRAIDPTGITTSTGIKIKYPNTNAYQGGNIVDTKVYLRNISPSGATMTLDINFGQSSPTPAPSPISTNKLELKITFDNFPEDIGYTFTYVDSGVIIFERAKGSYPMGTKTAYESLLLEPGSYVFQITDAFNGKRSCLRNLHVPHLP